MSATRVSADSGPAAYDIAGLIAELGDVPVITDSQTVRRRSRDYFWYSPVLNRLMHGLSADIIVQPRDEADVIRTAAACTKRRIPLTVRAADVTLAHLTKRPAPTGAAPNARGALQGSPQSMLLPRHQNRP